MSSLIEYREIKHFHLACGLGGGAKGFNRGFARVGNMEAKFRCLGGVDIDASALRDFERLTGTRGTQLDLFDRAQYKAYHNCEPPADWREATPEDLRRAAGYESPDIVFSSTPCTGLSGLLSEQLSKTPKYQALNGLVVRSFFLALEAFKDDLPSLLILENVPRIVTRGAHLIDQLKRMLASYGYVTAETTHDCGELGGLAQSRKRFLLVARLLSKVPNFLYEPVKHPLLAVGDVLSKLPMPHDPRGGVMHQLRRLTWKTWVRLAFVEAGSDWRSLNRLRVEDGRLADYLVIPEQYRNDYLGVVPWTSPAGTVTGSAAVGRGAFSVADPRPACQEYSNYGVRAWDQFAATVTSQRSPGQGPFSVADPRPNGKALYSKYAVTPWDSSTGTVIGGDDSGTYAVADPRSGLNRVKGDNYLSGGHYGMVDWKQSSYAVTGAACHDNGPWSVADPRVDALVDGVCDAEREFGLPGQDEKLVTMIKSFDSTWHRPFTTLELAVLQGLIDPDELFDLDGTSDGANRTKIGNAVPPPAAAAIASTFAQTLLLAKSGETFALSCMPIWVRDVAVALSVRQPLIPGEDVPDVTRPQ